MCIGLYIIEMNWDRRFRFELREFYSYGESIVFAAILYSYLGKGFLKGMNTRIIVFIKRHE